MSLMRPEDAVIHIESRTGCSGIVSGQTLKRWRSCRRGPEFVRIEGRVYYPEEAIDEWLSSNGIIPQSTCDSTRHTPSCLKEDGPSARASSLRGGRQ
jgi:hypothetical protein